MKMCMGIAAVFILIFGFSTVNGHPGKYSNCGEENTRNGEKHEIRGGTATAPNQYPWMVRLWGCGGALITERHVLTAKHCLCSISNGCRVNGQWKLTVANTLYRGRKIKVGVHNQDKPNDYQEVQVKEIKWPGSPDDHDFAMIILDQPVNLNDKKIGIVCLPTKKTKDYRGEKATAMGWGMTYVGSPQSPILKHVELTVSQQLSTHYLYTEVGDINGVKQDPCAGDSGGPLVHKDPVSGRWTIIGTVYGRGYDCISGKIRGDGKWNKVTAHLAWIESIIYKKDKDSCDSLTRKMKNLEDDPLNYRCSKIKRVKHGVWSCSEEENICFLKCDVGYKINTFECIAPPQQLVVTGGYADGGNKLATSELISADGVLCHHKIPNLPVAVSGASSVYFNNHLLVCGGYSGSGAQDSCHQLGSSTSTWTPADSLKIKRYYFSLTKVDEELYAVGGYNGAYLDSIEKLVAGKWQLLSQTMETPRSRHCTVYMASKKSLIVIGGYPATNEVKSLDINSLEWSTLDPLPVSYLFDHSCQLIQENGEDTIYVAGGYSGGSQSNVWKYNRGSWSSAGGQLKQARWYHSMGVWNGRLVVVGGYDGSGRLASLEQMDSIGNWETMPTKLAVARSATAMTAVPVESFKCLP